MNTQKHKHVKNVGFFSNIFVNTHTQNSGENKNSDQTSVH